MWDVTNKAADLGWIALAAGLFSWFVKQRASRRVKVGAAVWETAGFIVQNDKSLRVPAIQFAVFNGLLHDVGLHSLTIDLKRDGREIKGLVAPYEGELPETVRAQHSVTIRFNAEATHNIRRFLWRNEVGGTSYRLNLRLGNGAYVRTFWHPLSDPARSSDPGGGGAGSDWDDEVPLIDAEGELPRGNLEAS